MLALVNNISKYTNKNNGISFIRFIAHIKLRIIPNKPVVGLLGGSFVGSSILLFVKRLEPAHDLVKIH